MVQELADLLGAQEFIVDVSTMTLLGLVPRWWCSFAVQGGWQRGRGGRTSGGYRLPHAISPQANFVYQGDTSSSNISAHTWLPDTGATHHATPDIASLSSSEEYNGSDTPPCR